MVSRLVLLLFVSVVVGCAPVRVPGEPGPVDLDVSFRFDLAPSTRIGAWQLHLDDTLRLGEEVSSEPMSGSSPYALTLPDQGPERLGGMGSLGIVTGDAAPLALLAYDDLDDSEAWEAGEPILGMGWSHPIQLADGSWYLVSFTPWTLDGALDLPEHDVVMSDFTRPMGLELSGGFHVSLRDGDGDLPDRLALVSVLELEEPMAGPLPGRAVDVAVVAGSWSVDLPADPGRVFEAARLVDLGPLGHAAVELPLAYADDGDAQFAPRVWADPIDLDGDRVDSDAVRGGLCLDGSPVMAVYRPPPTHLVDAVAAWSLYGGETGWNLVTGLDGVGAVPTLVPTSAVLDFRRACERG